ncbi:MAG: hypothetical protein PHG85_02270 [Candidatus Altiarchaeota archaeon]|nr:hypothetical protein [Candidatus Altiarchaeota archaeon]
MKKSYVIIALIIGISAIVFILWQLGFFNRSSVGCECGLWFTGIKPRHDAKLTANGDFNGTFEAQYFKNADISEPLKLVNITVYNLKEGEDYHDLGCCNRGVTSKKCTIETELPLIFYWNDTFQIIAKDCTVREHNISDYYDLFVELRYEMVGNNHTRYVMGWIQNHYE